MNRDRKSRVATAAIIALSFVLNGCATHKPAVSSAHNPNRSSNTLSVQFSAAVLAPDNTTASYSFQKGKGKLGSPKEAFSEASAVLLGGPGFGIIIPGEIICWTINSAQDENQLMFGAALAGAAGVAGGFVAAGTAVAAPAVAAKGLIRSLKTVSPEELAEREKDLQTSLKEMASQDYFQRCLLVAAERTFPGRLVAADLVNDKPPGVPKAVDALFKARIEDLRLERHGSDESSYYLRIKAVARLVRKADGKLIYQQSVEYQSGPSLFLDWTVHSALEDVAQTGYRALADYFVALVFKAG